MNYITIRLRHFFVVALVFITFLITGCDLIDKIKEFLNVQVPDITEKVVGVLNNAIDDLNVASADWQDILQEAIDELPEEVQSTVTNEVSNLLNRAVSATGAEVRCNVDFFRMRIQQSLQRIKAKFLGSDIPPLEPQLCNVVPLAVDMNLDPSRRNKLEFYGYDFDMADVRVIHVSGNSETDVTRFLDQPTHYHMTLNLGGSGVPLNKNSNRLILRWNNRNISTIAIIQPNVEICETSYDNFRPANISYLPPLTTGGDSEFSGNGPDCYCSVNLINRGSFIEASVFFRARETKSNWTTASGTKTVRIYTADPGKTIQSIVGSTSASYSYIDNDHALDAFPGSGPVRRFVFMGDGEGSDVGRHTRVEIEFNPLRVQLKETGNCVPSATLRSLELSGHISNNLQLEVNKKKTVMKFIAPEELEPIELKDTVK